MMKKVLFVAAVAMSLVFSGCMKEDDTYKKLKPVQPGLNIYTCLLYTSDAADE